MEYAEFIVKAGAVATAVAAVVKVAVWPLVQLVRAELDHRRRTTSAVETVEQLTRMHLAPNGGSSLLDKVNAIDQRTLALDERFDNYVASHGAEHAGLTQLLASLADSRQSQGGD